MKQFLLFKFIKIDFNFILKVAVISFLLIEMAASVSAQNFSTALELNGSDTYVEANSVSAALSSSSAFTLEAWIYPEDVSGQNFVLTFHQNSYQNRILFGVTNGELVLGYYDTSDKTQYGITPIPLNTWTHISFSLDKSTGDAVAYINGQPEFAFYIPVWPDSDGRFSIGQDFDDTRITDVVDGKIDEVRIWNTVRSQTEIQNNKDAELTGNEPGLVAYYKMGNINGISVPDDSGNNNGGTLQNFMPIVNTSVVTSITAKSAMGNANISDLGYPNPVAHGFCWNTIGNPNISDNSNNLGSASSTGSFTNAISGLSQNTTYYVRAYATNSITGTNYGDAVSFTTPYEIPSNISVTPSNVAENQAVGTTVGTISATPAGTYSFELVSGVGDTDNSSFSLKVNSTEDLVSGSDYSYGIGIFSGDIIWQSFTAGKSGFLSKIMLKTTIGKNDTDLTIKFKIFKGEGIDGTLLGEVTTDLDTDENSYMTCNFSGITLHEGQKYTFQLIDWTFADYGWGGFIYLNTDYTGGKLYNNSFYPNDFLFKTYISASTEIVAEPSFNYEAKSSYSTRIKATNPDGNFYEEALTINVSDVNEAPTNIALSSSTVDENVAVNSTIGTLSTADEDAGDTFSYTLVSGTGSTNNSSFTIDGNNLRISNSPDFESKNSYFIRIRTTDQGGLTYEKPFQINVNDLNEPPTSMDFTASSGPYQNIVYTFTTSDFSYLDDDSDLLDHVRITAVPEYGTLYIDVDNDDEYDSGEELSDGALVSKTDLDAGDLQYYTDVTLNTSFMFDVNDGEIYSASTYTATLNIIPAVSVVISAQTNVLCSNDTNGSLTATVTPGAPNYSYSWSNGSATTNTASATNTVSGLTAGTYIVTVTDAVGNKASSTATIIVEDDEAPVVLTKDITVQLDENGFASILPSDVDNGSTDNCQIDDYSLNISEFDCNDVDNPVTVTLTVTDVNRNSNSESAIVTVKDTIKPAPQGKDLTIYLDENGQAEISATDFVESNEADIVTYPYNMIAVLNRDIRDIDPNDLDGINFSIDNSDIHKCYLKEFDSLWTYLYIDYDYFSLSPTSRELFGNNPNSIIFYNSTPDNCGTPNLNLSESNFTCNNVGVNEITVTTTDVNGNSSDTIVTITVVDNVPPVALAQNITVQLDENGTGSTTAVAVDNGSNDNCGIASIELSQTNFDCSHVGTNDVILTVTDNNGNVSTASAVVTVEDNIAPVALAQNVTIQLDENGTGSTTAAAVDNGSKDACGIASIELSQTNFDCSHVGTNDVILTVTDNNGNINTAPAVVTVEDNVAPVALAQNVTIQLDENGTGSTTAAAVYNGSNDACGIASIELSQTDFDCSHIGTNSVTLMVTDNNGNESKASAIVTVEDNVPPVVLTKDITVQLDENGNASIVPADIDNGSADACGIKSYSLDVSEFSCADINNPVTVTLTVTDENENSNTATAVVTVEDLTEPEMNGTDEIKITIDGPSFLDEISWYLKDANSTVIASGGTGATVEIIKSSNGPFTFYGETMGSFNDNILHVLIECGTTTMLSETIAAGTEATFANIPGCLVIPDAVGECSVTVTDVPTATDACAGTITGTTTDPLTYTTQGTHVITWNFDDGNGNDIDVTQKVIVDDVTDPELNDAAAGEIKITIDGPSFLDEISWNLKDASSTVIASGGTGANVEIIKSSNGPFTFYGETMGTFDDNILHVLIECGTTTMLSETISAGTDATFANIPGCVVIPDAVGECSVTITDVPTATDACAGTITGTTTDPLIYTTQGTHVIMWNFDDGNGNDIDVPQKVIVDDVTGPAAIAHDTTLFLNSDGFAYLSPASVDKGSKDACGIASLELSQTDFDCSHVGTNDVTLTVTDNNGNISTATAVVTVEDNVDPVALAQNVTIQLDENGAGSTSAAAIDNGSNDACGIASLELSQTDFDCSHVGTNDVILTVTDNNGNVSTASAVVTVEDKIAPIINCQSITVYLRENGHYVLSREELEFMTMKASPEQPTMDKCNPFETLELEISQRAFDCSHAGVTVPVVITATDPYGNSSSCETTVRVLDTISPVAQCKNLEVYLDSIGQAIITPDDIDAVGEAIIHPEWTENITEEFYKSYDACGISTRILNIEEFNCDDIGENVVQLKVADPSGNISSCTSVVTVVDTLSPIVTEIEDINIEIEEGTCETAIDYPKITTTEECKVSIEMVNGLGADGKFPIGTTTETWKVTDSSGNESEISFDVTVSAVNSNPTLDIIPDITVDKNRKEYSIQLTGISYGNDCEAQDLVISVTGNNLHLFNQQVINYIPGNSTATLLIGNQKNSEGSDEITVTVEDEKGAKVSRTFTLTAKEINHRPVLVHPVQDITMNVLEALKIPLAVNDIFEDPDGDKLQGELKTEMSEFLPGWIKMTGDTLFLNPAQIDTGYVSIIFKAVDSEGAFATDTFNIDVEDYVLNTKEFPYENLSVEMYPNPTNGWVNLDFNTNIKESVQIRITDIAGKRIIEKQYSEIQKVRFNVNDFESGIYLVNIKINDAYFIKKLVVNRK